MTSIDIKITNPNGLTPRLAAELVEEANNYSCNITMSDDRSEKCDLKSIMNVFGTITAGYNENLHLEFEGEDENNALNGFKELFDALHF